ncbi:MAG: chemotaxis protein CheW [Clostridiales bacterium]|nr:chemotaxis protein CheW [Clostridiales bacterium]
MSSKYAVFTINDEEYGMDVIEVSTIEKGLAIKKMENAPENVKGKTDLRGDEIPVYSLRKRMGFEDRNPDKDTRFLIVNSKGINIAVEIDRMTGIVDVEDKDIHDVPKVAKNGGNSYIKSIANMGEGRLILILDGGSLLTDDELAALRPKK